MKTMKIPLHRTVPYFVLFLIFLILLDVVGREGMILKYALEAAISAAGWFVSYRSFRKTGKRWLLAAQVFFAVAFFLALILAADLHLRPGAYPAPFPASE